MKRAVFTLAALCLATSSHAQSRERLSMLDVAHPVALDPGGEVIVRGAVRSAHDGTVFDAVTARPGAEGVEGEGTPVPGGLYDIEAGGWRLVSRDLRAHAYRLAATGEPGRACVEAGVRSPCLPLRLLPLAQTRLLAVSDFARTLSGEVTLEVLNPDSTPLPVPPFLERHGAKLALAAFGLAAAALAARSAARRASTPEAQLRDTAARVRRRLAGADPVHRQLAPSIDALVAHAVELIALRDKLSARVSATDRAALVQRRDALPTSDGDAGPEAARARALIDEQIERVDRWRREAERASARVAEVHEYLRALGQRLDEAIDASHSARDESTREALAALELDVQSCLEGAREAERVLS